MKLPPNNEKLELVSNFNPFFFTETNSIIIVFGDNTKLLKSEEYAFIFLQVAL